MPKPLLAHEQGDMLCSGPGAHRIMCPPLLRCPVWLCVAFVLASCPEPASKPHEGEDYAFFLSGFTQFYTVLEPFAGAQIVFIKGRKDEEMGRAAVSRDVCSLRTCWVGKASGTARSFDVLVLEALTVQ